MIARMLGGAYEPSHARRRGRYKSASPQPSAGLYAWCLVAVVGALTWPIPAVLA